MKGELSALRSELTSLGIEESRISEQLNGLRDANEMLLAKAKSLEAEIQDSLRRLILCVLNFRTWEPMNKV